MPALDPEPLPVIGVREPAARAIFSTLAFIGAMFIAIVALRVALVAAYAKSLPFWDEWGASLYFITHGGSDGTLGFLDLFSTSNEHTIFFTRLISIVASWLNQGQFDNVPVVLMNAVLYAGTWSFGTGLFIRHAPHATRYVPLAFALCGIAPVGWENILTGFQSCFIFVVLGALVCIWLAASTRNESKLSLAGFAAACLAACVTLGSGFCSPLIAAAICAWRAWREPYLRGMLITRAAIACAAAGFGLFLLLRAPLYPVASNTLHFTLNVLTYLGWPYALSPLAGVLAATPMATFFAKLLRQRGAAPLDLFALGLAAWSFLQVCALVTGRPTYPGNVAPRYFDVMIFWPLTNLYALARVVTSSDWLATTPIGRWLRTVPIVATALFVGIIVGQAAAAPENARIRSESFGEQTGRVASYVRTGDFTALHPGRFLSLPYPEPKQLKAWLDDPLIRAALPSDVREPLKLEAEGGDPSPVFAPNGFPRTLRMLDIATFGSFTTGKTATGVFRSTPIKTGYPYLVLDVGGYLPWPDMSLQLACETQMTCVSQQLVPEPVGPAWQVGQTWQRHVVPAPGGPFRIVASDQNPAAWFAFSAPREIGTLSYWTMRFVTQLRTAPYACLAMVVAAIMILLLAGWFHETSPSTGAEERACG
jgi:hypothetical protein